MTTLCGRPSHRARRVGSGWTRRRRGFAQARDNRRNAARTERWLGAATSTGPASTSGGQCWCCLSTRATSAPGCPSGWTAWTRNGRSGARWRRRSAERSRATISGPASSTSRPRGTRARCRRSSAEAADDLVFYATDVPHWDHDYPQNLREMASREDLTPESRRKILRDNAHRLYGGGAPGTSRRGHVNEAARTTHGRTP